MADTQTFLTKSEVTYWGSSGPGSCRKILFPTNNGSLYLEENLSLTESMMRNGRRIPCRVETPIELSDRAKIALEIYTTAYNELQEAQKRFEATKEAFKQSVGGQELAKLLVPEKEKLTLDEVWPEEEVKEIVGFVESLGVKVARAQPDMQGHSVGELMLGLAEPVAPDFLKDMKYKDYSMKSLCIACKEGHNYIQIYKTGLMYPAFRTEDYKEIMAAEKKALEKYQN